MNEDWRLVPLGEVVKYRKEFIAIDDLETYKRCRVQLHAQGIVLRDSILGAQIKTKKQQVCRTGDFLVAEIDAKVGGFGIVPENLDEAIVSSHYYLFEIDESILSKRFLDYFIRTPTFREQVRAQGSTNYAAIRPQDVLGYTMPLPPLEEQQRIVRRIEELSAKIEEARGLRSLSAVKTEKLLSSTSGHFFDTESTNTQLCKLSDLTIRITKGESPEWQGFSYQETGALFIRSENVLWGSLNLSKRTCIPIEFHQKLNRSQLQVGDVLVNLVGASIGRSCVVPVGINDANVNQAVAVISPDKQRLDSYYLMEACA